MQNVDRVAHVQAFPESARRRGVCAWRQSQYGVNWWRAIGLIPGPQSPADWVERPAGESSITVFSPQQFWDPRACPSNTFDRRGPKGR